MKRTSLWGLSLLLLCSRLYAQGLLPPTPSSSTVSGAPQDKLVINQSVSPNLEVLDEVGKARTLLSYKSPVEVLLVGFFSSDCAANEKQWVVLRRLFDRFQEWRVSLVIINEGPSLSSLREALQASRITPDALVDDPNRRAAHHLAIRELPTFAVIDENGALRYRGPLEGFSVNDKSPVPYARKALDAVIGHISAVPATEPHATASCPFVQP